MDEDEYDDEEVYVDEDENENPPDILTRLKTRLKTEALSVARQLYCFSSVMMFPVLGTAYEKIETVFFYPVNATIVVKYQAKITLQEDCYEASVIGLIIGGIFLFLIGRKYSVIAANLSHLACLSFSYLTGAKPPIPFGLSMLNFVVEGVSFVAFSIYVAEIASPTFRAFFLGLYFLNAAFASHVYVEYHMLTMSKANQFFRNSAILTAVSFVFALFTPETPFWLALKGNREEAEEIFKWLRAGKSDTYEFNLLLARAENITDEHGFIKQLFSRTIVLGTIFSLMVSIGNFQTCTVMLPVLNDAYYRSDKSAEYKTTTSKINVAVVSGLNEGTKRENPILGPIIFLVVNFIMPRKVLYFVLYACSVFIIAVIRLKLATINILRIVSSLCSIVPISGITPLQMILPIEIYPIALREIGVVTGGIFNYALKYAITHNFISAHSNFISQFVFHNSFFIFYTSLFLVPFMLVFMPETKNTNIYQLDELAIRLPMVNRKRNADDEDEYYEAEYED